LGGFAVNSADANSDRVRPHAAARQMVRAVLMGSHSHKTSRGICVHIWQRNSKYLARGSYERRRFGVALGSNEDEALAELRRLLCEIDDGSFVPSSEARHRPMASRRPIKLTCRQLVSEFLAETRKTKGQGTARDYGSRLEWVLKFAEQMDSPRRWPMAADIDRNFVIELRVFLNQSRTSRNGRAGASTKPLSSRHVRNIMESLRTMLNWASRPMVGKLPAGWLNPATDDLIGRRSKKDPLRPDVLPLDVRIRLIAGMDRWQLCHFCFSAVLPMRPDEVAGLLITDVDFRNGWFRFRTRLGGDDFNKEQQDFVVPFPVELLPFIQECIGGRTEGPLLRSRAAYEQNRFTDVTSFDHLHELFQKAIIEAGDEVQSEQDRKRVFRQLLQDLGGISEGEMYRTMKRLMRGLGLGSNVSLKSLRSAVTTGMKDAKLSHLALRYFTSHDTSDILNEYTGLEPAKEIQPYFQAIEPLLAALKERAGALGIGVRGSDLRNDSAGSEAVGLRAEYNGGVELAGEQVLSAAGCIIDAPRDGFFVVHGWCTHGARG
jgi:integrase